MWKEFDLSRNPRNGGDVLAKDVDGHHGGELRKKTFIFTKENDKVLARLDTKIRPAAQAPFLVTRAKLFKL